MKVYFVKLQNDYWSNTENLNTWCYSPYRFDAAPFFTRKEAEETLKGAIERARWEGSYNKNFDHTKLTRADFKIVSLKEQSALKFWFMRLSSKIEDLEAKMENHRL